MSEPILRLEAVTKFFGPLPAVDNLSLEVQRGEVFTLLGPSGCGKTTTLRLVAGLERPDAGEITCQGRSLVSVSKGHFVPPYRRNMGMVFQSYAIWPHLTVFENVAYPLQARRVDSKTIRQRVEKAVALVGLSGLESRPAPLLSGGQQQRVAIARALVYEPDLLLLDEPFSNLDAKLREHMRLELCLLQRRLGITVLFVTHDQVEALTLSDRIAVMHQGKCEQIGSPKELYERPATAFVRDFLGKSNVLEARVIDPQDDGNILVALGGESGQKLLAQSPSHACLRPNQPVWLSIRPEDVMVDVPRGQAASTRAGLNSVGGVIETLLFLGDRYESRVVLDGSQSIIVYLPKSGDWVEGQAVQLTFPRERLGVWPA